MTVEFFKEKSVKYVNKDFGGFKRDLIRFAQAHHSGVFRDFNEASPGMMLLELAAYVGDVLSFYQDAQFEELKQESARQVENVVAIAKQHGYRPAGKRAARGSQTFFIEVPATVVAGARVPDDAYTPVMRKGARASGPNGVVLETLDDVHFSASSVDVPRLVTGSRFDSSTGLPTHFALRKDVDVVAGETKVDTFTLGDFQAFREIELSNADVIEVISVADSDGNEWTEVDFLAQQSVFDLKENAAADGDVVPYVMRLVPVPRRYVVDRDPTTEKTKLVFGSGDGVNFDDQLLPNVADLALPLAGRRTFSAFSIDPQNFLKTRSLGLSPYDATLTVTYRVGGGPQTNVPAGSVKNVDKATLDFATTGLDVAKKGDVEGSLETINLNRTEGGAAAETIGEIKANSAAFFAAQNRAVTREDFIARVLSLPAKFGKPDKVHVRRDAVNPLSLSIHVLARDADGHLTQATSTLTQNIKTYLGPFRMLTDGINVMQANIVNLRVGFGVVVSPKMNRTEVLAKCLSTARDFLSVDSTQIGQPIVVSELFAELQRVLGVVSVYKLELKNVFGNQADGSKYSSTRFDVGGNTSNGILYCPEDSIFEVKYPARDIVGEAK